MVTVLRRREHLVATRGWWTVRVGCWWWGMLALYYCVSTCHDQLKEYPILGIQQGNKLVWLMVEKRTQNHCIPVFVPRLLNMLAMRAWLRLRPRDTNTASVEKLLFE